MSGVEERLGKVEDGLGKVEGRLELVEGRLESVEGRLESVEGRLESVETKVDALDGKLATLDGKLATLDGKVGGLAQDVQKLRVLGEDNAREIKLFGEAQARHGELLQQHGVTLDRIVKGDIEPFIDLRAAVQQIAQAVTPLKDIRDFMDRVTGEHEARISELEKRVGVPE